MAKDKHYYDALAQHESSNIPKAKSREDSEKQFIGLYKIEKWHE